MLVGGPSGGTGKKNGHMAVPVELFVWFDENTVTELYRGFFSFGADMPVSTDDERELVAFSVYRISFFRIPAVNDCGRSAYLWLPHAIFFDGSRC